MISIIAKNKKIIITADDINPIETNCGHKLQIGKWLITVKANSSQLPTTYNL
jgi:hypothetical protein